MRKGIAAALAALSISFGAPAAAADLVVDSSTGKLTGAAGVNVNGTLYDVTFVDGTCAEVFNSCDNAHYDFNTQSEAQTAAQALLDQVFVGTYDSDAALTVGCEYAYDCYAFIPFNRRSDGIDAEVSVNTATGFFQPDRVEFDGSSFGGLIINYPTGANFVWARFTASSVPEPATWGMMLLGFGAIGMAMRRRAQPATGQFA